MRIPYFSAEALQEEERESFDGCEADFVPQRTSPIAARYLAILPLQTRLDCAPMANIRKALKTSRNTRTSCHSLASYAMAATRSRNG